MLEAIFQISVVVGMLGLVIMSFSCYSRLRFLEKTVCWLLSETARLRDLISKKLEGKDLFQTIGVRGSVGNESEWMIVDPCRFRDALEKMGLKVRSVRRLEGGVIEVAFDPHVKDRGSAAYQAGHRAAESEERS